MKKLLHCYIVTLLIIATVRPTLAVKETTPPGQLKKEATSASETKKEDVKDKIEDLKERVATRVAELRQKSKRSFSGQIKSKGENSLILEREEKQLSVTINEETVIVRLGPTKKQTAIDFSALEVGEQVVAFGTLGLEQKTLPAKRILAHTLPKNIHGTVSEVDIDAGTLTMTTDKERTLVIDYEIGTKCQMFQKEKGLVNCGLTKIQIGDRVFVRGTVNQKDSTLLTALRILLLPSKPL